jgi:putative transposase
LNALKKTDLGWMYAVSKCAPQEALRNLDRAFAHFFRRVKEKKAGKKVKVGYPQFKSKKNGLSSFRLTGTIRVFDDAIQLPRLGRLRLKERGYVPSEGVRILNATVSERAGRWFVSVQVEMEQPDPAGEERPVVGVDLGIARLATGSDGASLENPRALKRALRKIKRWQRTVSRRQKGSANRRKAVARLAQAHGRVANLRKDTLHQATSRLAKTKSVVVLEDLNVSGMLHNHPLAQAIADAGLYEFRRQMTYKGAWYGCRVVIAPRYYPSTKRCSRCGNVKTTIGLGERVYECEVCGLQIDRDLNAALNLEQWYRPVASDGMGLPSVRREVTPVERV